MPVVAELENLFYEKLRLQVTVCLLNDADAAIAAEVWGDSDGKYGQYSNIAMVTLGTGIALIRLLCYFFKKLVIATFNAILLFNNIWIHD